VATINSNFAVSGGSATISANLKITDPTKNLIVGGKVSIGKTTNPTSQLDVSGSSIFGGYVNLNNISEKVKKISQSGGNVPLNCNDGSILNIGSIASISGHFTLNITNLPNLTDDTKSYIFTIIYKSANLYCNKVTLSTTATTGTPAYDLKINGTIPTFDSTKTIVQQIVFLFDTTAAGSYYLSTINIYG
jgi:hypothetical protein